LYRQPLEIAERQSAEHFTCPTLRREEIRGDASVQQHPRKIISQHARVVLDGEETLERTEKIPLLGEGPRACAPHGCIEGSLTFEALVKHYERSRRAI
jgi:hypothetical protein